MANYKRRKQPLSNGIRLVANQLRGPFFVTLTPPHGFRAHSFGSNDVVKGESVPLQAWSGPEGTRKLSFPDYVTMAQDGGKVVSFTHRPLLPLGNIPGTHFC